MNFNQLTEQIDLLEVKLEKLRVSIIDYEKFAEENLTCEEEIAKRILIYKQPEITRVQASLMIGDCGEDLQRTNVYEFAGLTGSVDELREKIGEQVGQIWGPLSNTTKQLKEESKKIKKQFLSAINGFFDEMNNIIYTMNLGFIKIGASFGAIGLILAVPPFNVGLATIEVIHIVEGLIQIIRSFIRLLVHLSPLALLVFVLKREKIEFVIQLIGKGIQVILNLLDPLKKIKEFIFKILGILKKKPSCQKQRKRLEKQIRQKQRKKDKFNRRANRTDDKAGYPDWRNQLFTSDPEHTEFGGELIYTKAEKIIRNDVEIIEQNNNNSENFIDAVEGFDEMNEEIKTLEENLSNICKKTTNSQNGDPDSLFDGYDEDAIDRLIDKVEKELTNEIDQNFQDITNRITTYAVKYPDGTVRSGVTDDELEELKNVFKVEIRDSFSD